MFFGLWQPQTTAVQTDQVADMWLINNAYQMFKDFVTFQPVAVFLHIRVWSIRHLRYFYSDGFWFKITRFDLLSDSTCAERPNAFLYSCRIFNFQMHCSAPWPLSSTMLTCLTVKRTETDASLKCLMHIAFTWCDS